MGDPLSAVGSVAGLISLAIQLSQVSFQYVSSVSGSSKAWSSYIQELSTLTAVLLKLQQASDHIGVQSLSHILPTAGLSAGTLRECHDELDRLKSTLSEKLAKRGLRRKLEMLGWPFSESETQKTVMMLHRFSGLFESSLVADNLTVSVESYRHLKNEKEIKDFNELLDWFKPKYESSPLSPEVILEPTCPGTRPALLTSDLYGAWRDSGKSITQQPLWLRGPPGAGKSVLSATIVNDILSLSRTIVAYHFFRDSQEETLHDVLRHISYQLLSQPNVVSQVASDIYEKKKARGASLLLKDLMDVICDISTSSDQVYIILDGLDEFAQCTKLLKHLPQLVAAKATALVSSRELPNIAAHLVNSTVIDACAEQNDTESYVQWRLDEESEVNEDLLTDDLKRDIVSNLATQTNGSFLLIRLVMDSICDATTIKKIRHLIEFMPRSYEDAYEGTLHRIRKGGEERRKLAFSALDWICNAKRPLEMTELQHAIASLEERPEYTSESLEPVTAILSSCLGLLVVSKTTHIVDLVHLSARESVLEQLKSQTELENIAIGRACLRYMAVPEMAKGPCQSLDGLKIRISDMPFLDYATRYYGYHVSSEEETLQAELFQFLSDERYRESAWQMLHLVVSTESESAQDLISSIPSEATILHVSCYWGLALLLRTLLASPSGRMKLDKADSHGWSPLHWASSNGHVQIVAALLEAGANINLTDKSSWTPLFWAVVRGQKAVAQLLMDHGSSPFAQDQSGFTPVHWAVLGGDGDLTTLLLEEAQDSYSRFLPDKYGSSASMTKLTIEEAKALRTPRKPGNLLQLVTEISDQGAFQKLATLCHERYSLDEIGLNTFNVSALWDRTKILVSKGDSGFWSHLKGKSPSDAIRRQLLTTAIQCEDVKLVKSIVDLSRDLGTQLAEDVVSRAGAGYVHVAAYSGSPEIMRMMAELKLSLRATDSRGFTALHYACRTGCREVLDVILKANVEVDARDQKGRTPMMLFLACSGWRTCDDPEEAGRILNILLAKGASIRAKDSSGYQPIHYAMATMNPGIIQTLLDLGADPGTISDELITPLHALAEGFNGDRYYLEGEGYSTKYHTYQVPANLVEKVAELVLRISPHGALRAETAGKATALGLAIKKRRWIIAQTLYAAGAPFQCKDDLSDVFETTAKNGFYEFVDILIKAGVTPQSKDFFPAISVSAPAQKSHHWKPVDISGSDAFPQRDHAQVLNALLPLNVDVNHKHSYLKSTAMQLAADRGVIDPDYITTLLKNGADPYAETDEGLNSFDLAFFHGKLDNLAVLVQHAAQNPSGTNWLTIWLQDSGAMPQDDNECCQACMAAIFHAGCQTAYDANGHTFLFYAIREGNQMLAEELIKLGANPNFGDHLGWTPLHEAVRTHRADAVELLIRNGADVLLTVDDISPFSNSTVLPHPDDPAPIINALHLAVGIHPHNRDIDARNRMSPEIVRMLLETGIDPNAKTINIGSLQNSSVDVDASPLQIMFRKYGPRHSPDFFAVVQLLVDFGADVSGIADGMEVYDVASFEGYESLWEVFRKADAVGQADSVGQADTQNLQDLWKVHFKNNEHQS
ncbi:ankyrin [Ophiobolus disseminans]|uniref:Ankyrin n=1 Tax=Ophiobolus disseminans TaxID=1469910 RepID=A0A6A6ZXZ2_9PLEO|nr:ankyrin [Ophiobolus disseminans]